MKHNSVNTAATILLIVGMATKIEVFTLNQVVFNYIWFSKAQILILDDEQHKRKLWKFGKASNQMAAMSEISFSLLL